MSGFSFWLVEAGDPVVATAAGEPRWLSRYAEGTGDTIALPPSCPCPIAHAQAQLEPTAESVLAMLEPALCTFCPWELACS